MRDGGKGLVLAAGSHRWGALATWAVSFGNIMCWPDLIPRHLLAVGLAGLSPGAGLAAVVALAAGPA